LIGRADALRKRRGNAAGQERSHVQLLPGLKVSADHDCDLGVELHDDSVIPGRAKRGPQVRNCAPGNLEILWCAIAHHSSVLRTAPEWRSVARKSTLRVAGPGADDALLAAELVAFAGRGIERGRDMRTHRIAMRAAGIFHIDRERGTGALHGHGRAVAL